MSTINERAPGLLDQSPWSVAHQAERSERIKQFPRRTPEAQADIAAARAAPSCAHAMYDPDCAHCETDRIERASAPPSGVIEIDAALSNAALADTPAVREMGGAVIRHTVPGMDEVCTHATFTKECRVCRWRVPTDPDGNAAWGTPTTRQPYAPLDPANLPPGVVLLAGPEAERYRAITAAARKAQASAATARADGAALLQLFQAFCAGLAPGKDKP